MKLIDREDLLFLPLFLVALLVRWSRLQIVRRGLARFLAALANHFSRSKRSAIERALDQAYGASITCRERKAILRGSLLSVWTEFFTLICGPHARPDYLPCEVRGLDNLRRSLADGRGVILWESNGVAARWMWKRFLVERGFPLHQIHGFRDIGGLYCRDPQATLLRRRLLVPFVRRCEAYFVAEISVLPGDGSVAVFRKFHRWLGENQVICIAGDGLAGQRRMAVPYLGRSVRLPTGMASLARATGAALHPIFCVPGEAGGYVLAIGERLPAGRGDRDQTARGALFTFAQSLEEHVRRYPEHYRTWHLVAGENLPGQNTEATAGT